MSEELHIKAIIDEVDDSKLQQSLNKSQSSTGKAVSGGGGRVQTTLDTELGKANKLQDRFKLLSDVQKQLASQPGMEKQLAKVNQELAGVYGSQKKITTTSADYLKNLEKEVGLRKQARDLVNNSEGGSNQFSAHSQRQMQYLQQIVGKAPGGNVLNQFIGGAGKAGGEGGGGMGAMAGGGMAAGAAVAAAAVAFLVSKMGEMASRAQELAQSAGSATSSLGQLRSATERTKINQDSNAVSGGVTVAGIQQWAAQFGDSVVGGLFNDSNKKKQDTQAAIKQGLGGDSGENWRRIKEQGQDLNVDLARQKQGLDIQQFRQNRDYALDLKQFTIDTANTAFDLQKSAQRQEQDYQIARTQFNDQFQEKQSAKAFAFQKQYAQEDYKLGVQRQTQDYQIGKQRAATDLQINLADKSYDFGVSRQRAATDYGTQRADTKFDFSKSQTRNQQEFDINKGRQGQDRSEQLMKMALGGASGQDYLFESIDYRKQQQRQAEDFARQKKLATEDYTISTGRSDRDFNLGQSRSLADYNLGNIRDIRGFNIGQGRGAEDFSKTMGRGAQDFSISNQRMDTSRQMQIDAEQYSRKYQGIQLEIGHNRNLEDASIALQRFTQATGMQAQRLSNQGVDISQDQALANRDFAISSYRALRGQSYNEQDFAGQQRKDNPLGAYGQSLTDPVFADALSRNAKATGQDSLGVNIDKQLNDIDWGNLIGNGLAWSIGKPVGMGDDQGGLKDIDTAGSGSANWGSPSPSALPSFGRQQQQAAPPPVNFTFNAGSTTFPSATGVSQGDLERLARDFNNSMDSMMKTFCHLIEQQYRH